MQNKKKGKKSIALRVVLIAVAVVVLLGGGLLAKIKYEQNKMTPLATGEVIPGVYAIDNGFVNFYLIEKGDGYLMIDAGNDLEQTKTALDELKILPEEIQAILLTHSDSDHVTALSLFTNAQIYLSGSEIQMIDGTTRRSPMGHNHLEQDYETLEDGEEINLCGFAVRCISTPGHTPGSMSFLIDEQYLFAGDTMSLQNGKAATFNDFYNMDSEAQEKSIRRLAAETQPAFIFTGHYGYTDDAEMAFGEW